jgi:hypothetical protein
MTAEFVSVFIFSGHKRQWIPRPVALVHGLSDLRWRNRLRQTRHRAIGISQRFDMFFVIVANDDNWKILATRADCAEQCHSMRPWLEVDYGKIEVATGATHNLQRLACAVSEVTETTGLHQDIRDGILQLWIIRQKKYLCLHAHRVHDHLERHSPAIAI